MRLARRRTAVRPRHATKPRPPTAPMTAGAAPSLTALPVRAAEGGHPVAQWKLGRIMPTATASRRTTCAPSTISATSPTRTPKTARPRRRRLIVANAFVALGRYYLNGIPNSREGRYRTRAGNVLLCRVLFRQRRRPVQSGADVPDGARHAARRPIRQPAGSIWPRRRAGIRRRPCSARCCSPATAAAAGRARPDVADAGARQRRPPTRSGSRDSYNDALWPRRSEEDRAMALQMLERWVQGRRTDGDSRSRNCRSRICRRVGQSAAYHS